MHIDNWIRDIYERIENESYIPPVKERKYQDEISWCYRLGYIDSDERENAEMYLTKMVEIQNRIFEHEHSVYKAQLAYEQNLIREKIREQEEIKNLFKTGMHYRNGKYEIIS